MISRRRLTLQLTPLLDLLLIVIFAQYLDAESRAHHQVVAMTTNRDLLSFQLDEALKQLIALRSRVNELQEGEQLAQVRSREAEQFRVQRDLIGEMVAEMFQIPDAAVEQLFQQKNVAGPGPSASDRTQLQQRLKNLSGGSANRVIDHLLAFGEMRKRIDLWELYLSETGELTFQAGDRKHTFRADNPADFATHLFDLYKTLPESKSMVLILFSYGDARFKPLKAALDGLQDSLERMRVDSASRARFEYAVLGFRPVGPDPQR